MKKIMLGIAITSVVVMVGCVSVESTRVQLKSGDPAQVQKAKENIYTIATMGHDASGFVKFDDTQKVEYIGLVSDNALLLKIIANTGNDNIIRAAADKLDFSKPGFALEVFANHEDAVKRLRGVDRASNSNSGRSRKTKFIGRNFQNGYISKMIATLNESELERLALGEIDGCNYDERGIAANMLIDKIRNPEKLYKLITDNRISGISGRKDSCYLKIAQMADKISDKEVILGTINAQCENKRESVLSAQQKKALILRLSESDAKEYAMEIIKDYSDYGWKSDRGVGMELVFTAAAKVRNSDDLEKIIDAFLAKVHKCRKECNDSWNSSEKWTVKDDDKVIALIKKLPKLDDSEVLSLITRDDTSWVYFIDMTSVDVVQSVLSGGMAMTGDMELAFVKKLPKNRIDMKIYKGVKFECSRKEIYASMSSDLKKQAKEADQKALAEIKIKAKAAAKETFECNGFYLGMSFDDMKTVFVQQFPDWEIEEGIDGEGKDADRVLYVSGQRSPFCYASVNDNKVYQFNFGKKILKKWYKYDVQTYMEWSREYERENKIDMKFKLEERDTTVYEPDMSNSYRVWFHQETYQYKHNTKEYRLVYFGEEKDYTFEGGVGGAIIKQLAAPRFRYVRGDPGSLRVKIERD